MSSATSSFMACGSTARFLKHPDTGEPFDFVSMKHRYRTLAPEKDTKAFMKSALKWLAREFWEIENELEKLHSEVLFRRGQSGVGGPRSAEAGSG
ncbi:hypothetical protein GCM10009636_10780 [Arthrobacter koreensis]|uniref:hypothetical protein n=1 Tax=Arthrobacter koreensis TaxID=199136 RepID=UPI001265647C|nr:hypothetical protein [Arthrobacter koreensis]